MNVLIYSSFFIISLFLKKKKKLILYYPTSNPKLLVLLYLCPTNPSGIIYLLYKPFLWSDKRNYFISLCLFIISPFPLPLALPFTWIISTSISASLLLTFPKMPSPSWMLSLVQIFIRYLFCAWPHAQCSYLKKSITRVPYCPTRATDQ